MKSRSPYVDGISNKSSPNAGTSANNVQVSELLVDRQSRARRASVLKLTDECSAALNKAIEHNWPVRVNVTGEGVAIDVGTGLETSTRFVCSAQKLSGTMDAVCHDVNNSYQTVSFLSTKLVVNATEKTFAETREKAHKLAEEEHKKMTKNYVKQQNGTRMVGSNLPSKPGNSSKFKQSFVKPQSGQAKNSPATILASNSSTKSANNLPSKNISSTSSSNVAQQNRPPVTQTIQMRGDLLKRSIRDRTIHLCASGKFKTFEDLLERLQFEGIPKTDTWDEFSESVKIVFDAISTVDPESDHLTVKPEFYNEIDVRWPWYVSSERTRVRRLVAPQLGTSSSSIAPSRKSGAAPPLAPGAAANNQPQSGSSSHTPPINAESTRSGSSVLCSPMDVRASPAVMTDINETKSRKRQHHSPPVRTSERRERIPPVRKRDSPDSAVLTNSASSTTSPVDEVEHVAVPLVVPQKRRRTERGNNGPSVHTENVTKPSSADIFNKSKTVIVDSNPMNGSLVTSADITKEWEKLFPAVQDSQQALKYHELFEAEYPAYRKCYEQLSKISSEFNDLKNLFDQAPAGSQQQSEALKKIRERYDSYQSDTSFYDNRMRHADLHGKLAILKRRILEWEGQVSRDFEKGQTKRSNQRHRRSSQSSGSLSSGNSASSTTSLDSSGSGPHGYDEF